MSDFNNKLVIDLFKQRDALKADVERLTTKVAELYKGAEEQRQRIQRLKDSGDYLCAAAAFMGWHDKIEEWNKAKNDNQQ